MSQVAESRPVTEDQRPPSEDKPTADLNDRAVIEEQ